MLVDSRGYVCQTYCHMQTLSSLGGGRIGYLNLTGQITVRNVLTSLDCIMKTVFKYRFDQLVVR